MTANVWQLQRILMCIPTYPKARGGMWGAIPLSNGSTVAADVVLRLVLVVVKLYLNLAHAILTFSLPLTH
jgi:hypothetical protein